MDAEARFGRVVLWRWVFTYAAVISAGGSLTLLQDNTAVNTAIFRTANVCTVGQDSQNVAKINLLASCQYEQRNFEFSGVFESKRLEMIVR